jgi:hypothetical protein
MNFWSTRESLNKAPSSRFFDFRDAVQALRPSADRDLSDVRPAVSSRSGSRHFDKRLDVKVTSASRRGTNKLTDVYRNHAFNFGAFR